MKIKIVSFIKEVGVLTTALTLALVANFAYGQWSGPSGAPSAGTNVPPPLNVGVDIQTKDGGLTVDGGLIVQGAINSSSTITADGRLEVPYVSAGYTFVGQDISFTSQTDEYCDQDGDGCIPHSRLVTLFLDCGSHLNGETWDSYRTSARFGTCNSGLRELWRNYTCTDGTTSYVEEWRTIEPNDPADDSCRK